MVKAEAAYAKIAKPTLTPLLSIFCRVSLQNPRQSRLSEGPGEGVPLKTPDSPKMKLLETASRKPNLEDFLKNSKSFSGSKNRSTAPTKSRFNDQNEKHIPPLTKGTQLRTENQKLRTIFPFIIKRPCQSIPS